MTGRNHSQRFERVFFGRVRNKTQILRLAMVRPFLIAGTGWVVRFSTGRSRRSPLRWQAGELFLKMLARTKVPLLKYAPGEHDAGGRRGSLSRLLGENHDSFRHRGVHCYWSG